MGASPSAWGADLDNTGRAANLYVSFPLTPATTLHCTDRPLTPPHTIGDRKSDTISLILKLCTSLRRQHVRRRGEFEDKRDVKHDAKELKQRCSATAFCCASRTCSAIFSNSTRELSVSTLENSNMHLSASELM
jgi:hypothetical protein